MSSRGNAFSTVELKLPCILFKRWIIFENNLMTESTSQEVHVRNTIDKKSERRFKCYKLRSKQWEKRNGRMFQQTICLIGGGEEGFACLREHPVKKDLM